MSNKISQRQFVKMYEKRLEATIGKKKKKVAIKVLRFILKNIAFNVLVGNTVRIHKFGYFFLKKSENIRRYNVHTKKVDFIESEERFVFKPTRGLFEAIRDSSIRY